MPRRPRRTTRRWLRNLPIVPTEEPPPVPRGVPPVPIPPGVPPGAPDPPPVTDPVPPETPTVPGVPPTTPGQPPGTPPTIPGTPPETPPGTPPGTPPLPPGTPPGVPPGDPPVIPPGDPIPPDTAIPPGTSIAPGLPPRFPPPIIDDPSDPPGPTATPPERPGLRPPGIFGDTHPPYEPYASDPYDPDTPYEYVNPAPPGTIVPSPVTYSVYARTTTITTRTPTDRNRLPAFEAHPPILFDTLDTPVEYRAGEFVQISIADYGTFPPYARYYLTSGPDWLHINHNVIYGTIPHDLGNERVYLDILVASINDSAELAIAFSVLGTTILDESGTRLADSTGSALVATGGAQVPLQASFFEIPERTIRTTNEFGVQIVFNDALEGFEGRTAALLYNDAGTSAIRNTGIIGEGNRYVVTFRPPDDVNDAYFVRIPKGSLMYNGNSEPIRNIDSVPFNIVTDMSGDAGKVSEDVIRERQEFQNEVPVTLNIQSPMLRPEQKADKPLWWNVQEQALWVGRPFALDLNQLIRVDDDGNVPEDITITHNFDNSDALPTGFALVSGILFGTLQNWEREKYTLKFVATNPYGFDEVEVDMAVLDTGSFIPSIVSGTSPGATVYNVEGIWQTIADQLTFTVSFQTDTIGGAGTVFYRISPPNGYTLGEGGGTVSGGSTRAEFSFEGGDLEMSSDAVILRVRKNDSSEHIGKVTAQVQCFFS